MITTDNDIFHLSGKIFSYVIFVSESGYLQHAYYGRKIDTAEVKYCVQRQSRLSPKTDDINSDMAFDAMPSECGFYAHGDYREPTVVIERADGAAMSRFRYKSHKKFDGVPELTGMPHARGGGQTLSITLTDDFSPIEITLNYTVWDDSDVLVRNIEIKNIGKETVRIKKSLSFCFDLPDSDFDFMQLCGGWANERTPYIFPVHKGIAKLQSLRGISSHQINPFTALMRKNCTEENGECYGVSLIYSGSWEIDIEGAPCEELRVQGGINGTGFGWRLGAGKSFVTPQVALCYSDNGMGGMSRTYHDFLREQIMPPEQVYKTRPVVVNNWETTYFDFDNDKLFAIIDEAAKLGVDTFVLDDGWFGKRDSDKSGLGDWTVNEQKLKGGLKAVIERCKRNGLKFGLWFEPEAVCEDSELYREHPDWAIGKDGVTPARWRNQLVLDFTRKDVVDCVYNAVSKILKENDISYVKWDMNRSVSEFYSRALDDQDEFMHRYTLGFYDLAERLTKAFPKVFFEGCAGGGRFDAGALYYFPQIWTSDNTDAYERAKIQYGTSMCYPPSAMSCHVSVCPNHQTGRTTPFDTRAAIASLGAFGFELDPSKMKESEKSDAKRATEGYKRIQDLILRGDMYRLSDPFNSDLFCVMIVSKDKSHAYAVAECLRGGVDNKNRTVNLVGLDENRRYRVDESDMIASGADLASVGVPLPSLCDYECFVWHIDAVNNDEVYKEVLAQAINFRKFAE